MRWIVANSWGSYPTESPGQSRNGYRAHKLTKRLSPEQIEEVLQRYASGESAALIATAYGVATSALTRLLRERSVVVRKHGVPEEIARRLAVKYEAGATIAQLEAQHGLSHGAVSRALKKMGVQMRPKGRRRS